MGGFFIVLSLIVLVLAIIGLIFGRKAKFLGIRNRKIALLLIPAAFVLFVVGGILLPDTETAQTATTDKEVHETVAPIPEVTEAAEASTQVSPTPSPTPKPAASAKPTAAPKSSADAPAAGEYDVVIHFPEDKYPETASHIQEAIDSGESAVCTIDRNGADANRDESLEGIPTKEGYDRDEWPMAMCVEGGTGADIEYITPSDNRGAGSWVGNQLEDYSNGTRVLFVIDGGASGATNVVNGAKVHIKPAATPKPTATPKPVPTPSPKAETSTVYYQNCTAVRAAGADPIYEGDPGYSRKLDRDGDGVACE